MPSAVRRWNGWGFEGESYPLGTDVRAWLGSRLGAGDALAAVNEGEVSVPQARPLPALPTNLVRDDAARLRNACGQSFPDIVSLRSGEIAAFPDGVALPESKEEVAALVQAAATSGIRLVVRGGGTSVVGGVSVLSGSGPTLVLSLERLSGLVGLDAESRLATFLSGTLGPRVEAALAPHKLRLGHEPQSLELSTIGGWVATRSAGQRSTGVGKIEELVAGLEVVTSTGVQRLAPLPASAAGPELRRLLMGSEGRLGVITEATVRVRPVPEVETGRTVVVPGWERGSEACRALLQQGVSVEVLRLSDATESSFAASLMSLPAVVRSVGSGLLARGRFRDACILLLGWAGSGREVSEAMNASRAVWRAHGGVSLGRGGWRRWRRDRFRHPYLRDALLEAGYGVDTLETAAPWSRLNEIALAVRVAVASAAEESATRVVVLCHLSHAYRDGASLYFTLLWALQRGRELAQWRAYKAAATDALLAAGGTVSHHHGVGTMHAPYLEREVGLAGMQLLRAAVSAADPEGILNPGVLLQESD